MEPKWPENYNVRENNGRTKQSCKFYYHRRCGVRWATGAWQNRKRQELNGGQNINKAHDPPGLILEALYKKLVGFGSDRASVMVGKKGSVAGLKRAKKPELQSIHCYAQRLELVYKQSIVWHTIRR